jgi:hypothetical protein
LDRSHPQPTPYLLGIPRHLFGSAARGSVRLLKPWASRKTDPAGMFADQLKIVDLVGFFFGKHFYKPTDT